MQLTGHVGEVTRTKFSPGDGQHLASSSDDKTVQLWQVYNETCKNYGMLTPHNAAILDLAWSNDASHLFSCAADTYICQSDLQTGERVRKLKGHADAVHSLSFAKNNNHTIASGSDDASVGIWDLRQKECAAVIDHHYAVTAVAFSHNAEIVFTGSIDNDIVAYDVRTEEPLYVLRGHSDTITSLRCSPDGSKLLSYGMDSTRTLPLFDGIGDVLNKHQ